MHFSLYRGLASLLLAPDGQEIPITTLQNVLHMQRTSPYNNGSYGNACLSVNEEFVVIQRLQQHLQHVNAGFDSIYGQGGTDGFGSFNISHEKWELGVFRENLRRGVEQIVKTVLRGSSGYMNLGQPLSPTQTPTGGSRKPSLYTSMQSESISRMVLALENAYFFIVGESYRRSNVAVSSPSQPRYAHALYSSARHPVRAPSNMQEDIGSKSVPAISMSNYRNNNSFSSGGMGTLSPDLSTSSEPKYPGAVHEDAIQKTQLLTEALKPAKTLIRRDSSTSLKWTRSLSRRKSKKSLKRAISNPHLVSTTQNMDNTIDLVHLPQTNVPFNQEDQSHFSFDDTSEYTVMSTQRAPETSSMPSNPSYIAGASDFRTSAHSRESQGSRHTAGSNHLTHSSHSLVQPVSALTDGRSSGHSTEFAPFGKEPGPIMYVQSHAPAFSQRLDHALPTLPHEESTSQAMPSINNSIYPMDSHSQSTQDIVPDVSTSLSTKVQTQSAASDMSTELRVGPVPTPVSMPSSSVNAKTHSIRRKSPMPPTESGGSHVSSKNPVSSPSKPVPGAPSHNANSLPAYQRTPQDLDRISHTSTIINGEVITFPSFDEPSLDTHQNHRISVATDQRYSLVDAQVHTNAISSTPRKSHGDSVYDMYFAKTREDDTSVNRTPTNDKFKEEVPMRSRAAVTSQYFADPSRSKISRPSQPIGTTNNPIWQVVAGLNDRSSIYSEVDSPDKRTSDISVVSRRDTVAADPLSSEQDSRALFMEARSAKPVLESIPPLSLANASFHRLDGFDDDDTHTLSSTEDVPDDGKRDIFTKSATTDAAGVESNVGTASANTAAPHRSSSPIIELNDQGLPVQIVYYNDDELPAIMDKIASGNNSARIEFRRRSAYPDMQLQETGETDGHAEKAEDASHLARVEQSILSLLRPTFSSLKLGG